MTFQDHDPTRAAIEQDNRLQPDPELQLSGGKATPLQIASTIGACALIVGLVIYGLNNQRPEGADAVAASAETPAAAAAQTPPAGAQANQQPQSQGQNPQGQNSQSQNTRTPTANSSGQSPAETTGSGGTAGNAGTPKTPQPGGAPKK